MTEKRIDMSNPIKATYKEETVFIYFETFGNNPYVLCSYTDNNKGKFKLGKEELTY